MSKEVTSKTSNKELLKLVITTSFMAMFKVLDKAEQLDLYEKIGEQIKHQ